MGKKNKKNNNDKKQIRTKTNVGDKLLHNLDAAYPRGQQGKGIPERKCRTWMGKDAKQKTKTGTKKEGKTARTRSPLREGNDCLKKKGWSTTGNSDGESRTKKKGLKPQRPTGRGNIFKQKKDRRTLRENPRRIHRAKRGVVDGPIWGET